MPRYEAIEATDTDFRHLSRCRDESESIPEHREMLSIQSLAESFMTAVNLPSSSFSSAC
jgi:hypothetical protein